MGACYSEFSCVFLFAGLLCAAFSAALRGMLAIFETMPLKMKVTAATTIKSWTAFFAEVYAVMELGGLVFC